MSRTKFAILTFVIAFASWGVAAAKGKTAHHKNAAKKCQWGGLTDSRGRLVRCLTRAEAQELEAESPGTEPAEAEVEPKKSLPAVEIGATFVRGKTGVAKQRLSTNAIVYARCVADHGGLKKAHAEVRIRFQVAPNGRARDASVSKRRSVEPSAARCIRDAVEGSFVGVPSEQPTVGIAVFRLH